LKQLKRTAEQGISNIEVEKLILPTSAVGHSLLDIRYSKSIE
jgi:hypothetical protein